MRQQYSLEAIEIKCLKYVMQYYDNFSVCWNILFMNVTLLCNTVSCFLLCLWARKLNQVHKHIISLEMKPSEDSHGFTVVIHPSHPLPLPFTPSFTFALWHHVRPYHSVEPPLIKLLMNFPSLTPLLTEFMVIFSVSSRLSAFLWSPLIPFKR